MKSQLPDELQKHLPYHCSKHFPDDADEVGWVDKVECFEVFLVLAVESTVGLPQPRHGGLVLAGQSVVEVHQAVVLLHELVQSVHQVPGNT